MQISKIILIATLMLIGLPGYAKTCEQNISANDMIKYDKSELRVGAECTELTLTLTHSGNLNKEQMGHNWVLAASKDWENISSEGVTTGAEHDYLPQNDDRIIAKTSLIGGGESTTVTFDLSVLDTTQDYTYFCSFPGHSVLMNGRFILNADS